MKATRERGLFSFNGNAGGAPTGFLLDEQRRGFSDRSYPLLPGWASILTTKSARSRSFCREALSEAT